jgi:hypothetical protein
LESLGLPRWRLSISLDKWLELRCLERVRERVSPKAGVLPSWSGMVYGAGPLLLLPLFLENSLDVGGPKNRRVSPNTRVGISAQ